LPDRASKSESRPWGITALSIFFLAGAAVSLIASVSLLLPNSFLKALWRINPRAHENLSSLGLWSVLLLVTVSMFCAAASFGLWWTSRWGYRLAVGLITVNLIGDVANVLLGTEPRAIVGVPVAAAILFYLLSRRVRRLFSAQGAKIIED
jgi:hypothetical protein